ncbi:TRAP transporter small permease [Cobetia marina]|nr:TRAP transporter small permease [Cobetia marina]
MSQKSQQPSQQASHQTGTSAAPAPADRPPPRVRPESWLAALALGLIGIISLANVVVRYATDASFAFTEEFSVFLLVLLTLAGASVAIRRQAHIRIALLEDVLPLPLWQLMVVLQTLAVLVVLGLVVWFGGTFALEEYQWESLSPGLGLPNWWYVIWLPLLGVAMAWRQLQQCVDRLKQGPDSRQVDRDQHKESDHES